MKASLQNKIAPPAPAAPGTSPLQMNKKPAIFPGGEDKPNFKELLLNSNRNESLKRQAQQNGNLATAKDYDSFLESLSESTRQAKMPKNKLDKNDFLNLFITQLQQQDPLKPKDGAEMASQLAQFNSLEQMMNINSALERLETKTAEGQSIHYPNYLGKEILLRDGRLAVENGKVSSGGYEIKSAANQTVLEVRNELVNVVAVKEQGPKKAGMHEIEWDGRNSKGEPVPDGMYTFSLKGKDSNNKETEIPVSSRATITGIDLNDRENSFITSLGKAAFGSISQIGAADFKQQSQVNKVAPASAPPTDSPLQQQQLPHQYI